MRLMMFRQSRGRPQRIDRCWTRAAIDLIVLHDAIPNLDQALAKFKPAHTHDDDEVRYIVDGEGVFGFTMPDGVQ